MLTVGQTIIIKAWKHIEEKKMTCTGVYFDPVFNENCYEFDNGMKLYALELESNFDLWNSRNGYEIVGDSNMAIVINDLVAEGFIKEQVEEIIAKIQCGATIDGAIQSLF